MSATCVLVATMLGASVAFAQPTPATGVYLPPPPTGGADLVGSFISSRPGNFLGASGPLDITAPLRIYRGGSIESLAAGELGATETSEYYYGVFSGDQALGWARLNVDASGASRVLSVTSNAPDSRGMPPPLPLAASVDSALKQLATREELRSCACEARLVSIIGTTGSGPFYFLWLEPATGTDWIYTLEQRFKPADVETQRLYTTADFMQLIQPLAQQRLR